jgi:hypothetical protein
MEISYATNTNQQLATFTSTTKRLTLIEVAEHYGEILRSESSFHDSLSSFPGTALRYAHGQYVHRSRNDDETQLYRLRYSMVICVQVNANNTFTVNLNQTQKNIISRVLFSDITPCSRMIDGQRFGGTHRLHLHAGFLLGLLINSEDRGDLFFQNVI